MRENIKIKLLQNLLSEITKKYDEFIESQEDQIEKTFQKAIKDPLTNLYNRLYFFEYVQKFFKKSRRKDIKAVLIFLDLDNFKNVNDTLGHKMGDKILSDIAQILKEIFRDYDMVVRYGGDEFIIFTEIEKNKKESLNLLLENFKERLEKKFSRYLISVSYGISIFPEDAKDIKRLIEIADERMYQQKKLKKKDKNFRFLSL